MTRTLAVTREAAFGFAGVSFAALAETVAAPPPPPPLEPPLLDPSLTTTVMDATLLERSGSVVDIDMVSARSA